MKRAIRQFFSKHSIIIAILEGVALFLLIYGIESLNPVSTSWIYKARGDMFQHQIGFDFYRKADWMFPLGAYRGYPYPYVNSIIYTDSIPLLAVPFKTIRDVLPESFQYFGMWGLLCFILQSAASAMILKKLEVSDFFVAIAVPFFTVNTVFLFRLFRHSSLTGQWIILFSIYFWIRCRELTEKKCVAIWSLLCSLSVCIHFYYLPMVVMIMLSSLIRKYISDHKLREPFLTLIFSGFFVLIIWYLLGGFSVKASPVGGGLGTYALDVLAIVNPLSFSSFIPELFHMSDEAICYPGLACFIIATAVFFPLHRPFSFFRLARLFTLRGMI